MGSGIRVGQFSHNREVPQAVPNCRVAIMNRLALPVWTLVLLLSGNPANQNSYKRLMANIHA